MPGMKAGIRRLEIVKQIGTGQICYPSIFEQFLAKSLKDAMALAALTSPVLHCGPRWVGILSTYRLEKELAADFFSVLGKIVELGMKEPRPNKQIHTIIDTHNMFLSNDRDPAHKLSPDLFV